MKIILLTLAAIIAGQASMGVRYQNSPCAFSFEYPKDWQIVKNPDDVTEPCAATLRPANPGRRGVRNAELSTLTIQVSELTFLQMAADSGFDFDGGWLVKGRQGARSKADITNLNGWLILRGIAAGGCESGGRTVPCDEYRVVARHRDDDRVVSIAGGSQTEDVLEAILKTLKLNAH